MKLKILIGSVIAILLAIIAGGFAFYNKPITPAFGNIAQATPIGAATTSTSIAVTTSTRILATTTSPTDPTNSHTRLFASICNPSATIVYLNLNNDILASVPAGHATVAIAAAAGYDVCYEISDRNSYQGSVQASSTNQTSVNVFVSDYVQ